MQYIKRRAAKLGNFLVPICVFTAVFTRRVTVTYGRQALSYSFEFGIKLVTFCRKVFASPYQAIAGAFVTFLATLMAALMVVMLYYVIMYGPVIVLCACVLLIAWYNTGP